MTLAHRRLARSLAVIMATVTLLAATAGTQPQEHAPSRIISLIPAVTEMFFAIGAGPQVVAVSSFDRFPPDVEKLPRVGALSTQTSSASCLCIRISSSCTRPQTNLREQLERAKVPVYVYSHAALPDVLTHDPFGGNTGRAREGR